MHIFQNAKLIKYLLYAIASYAIQKSHKSSVVLVFISLR